MGRKNKDQGPVDMDARTLEEFMDNMGLPAGGIVGKVKTTDVQLDEKIIVNVQAIREDRDFEWARG